MRLVSIMETVRKPEFAVSGHTREKAMPNQCDKGSRPGVVHAGACAQERGRPVPVPMSPGISEATAPFPPAHRTRT